MVATSEFLFHSCQENLAGFWGIASVKVVSNNRWHNSELVEGFDIATKITLPVCQSTITAVPCHATNWEWA